MESPSSASTVLFSSLPSPTKEPPILSERHLSLSPQRENRPKRSNANYSNGRWSSEKPSREYEDENNKNNNRKEVVSKAKNPPEKPVLKIIEIKKRIGLVVEANKALVQQNLELQAKLTATINHNSQFQSESMISNKRKLQEISSLLNVVATQKEKLHLVEMSHESVERANKKLKKEKQDLVKWLQDTKATVPEQEQDLLSLRNQKEKIKREANKAYKRGVSKGQRQEILENNNKQITLPDKLDPTTLAQLITEAFTEVHKNKKPHQCAAIAAKAVWNL
jgi:hypothetical protein